MVNKHSQFVSLRGGILLSIALLALGLGVGAFISLPHPDWQIRSGDLLHYRLSDLWLIAGRNLRIGAQLLLGALTFGLYGAVQLFSIGVNFGASLDTGISAGLSPLKVALLLLPHSIFEFAGFVALCAVEFEAARLMYRKLRYDLTPESAPLVRQFVRQSLIGFGLIVVGAVIETTLTVTISKRLL